MSGEQQVSSTPDGTLSAHDVVELDKILDGVAARSTEPTIVVVDGPQNESVYWGIAGRSGFVSKATEPPYYTTVGDVTAEGHTIRGSVLAISTQFEIEHHPLGRESCGSHTPTRG